MNSNLFLKLARTPRTIIDRSALPPDADFLRIGRAVETQVKALFAGSLSIRVVTAGSTNACEQELVALGNPYYDVERFGIRFVASPRHADMLMVTGPVSRNMREALLQTFEAMPEPRLVVAVGDDAIDGGIFRGSYAVCDGVKSVLPVDYEIPGDPPSPRQIIGAVLALLSTRAAGSSKSQAASS